MLSEVYLMSSLPSLTFGQAPPISMEEFSAMVESELPAKSSKALEQVSILGMEGKRMKGMWKSVSDMQDALKKDITEIRASRKEKRQANPSVLPASILDANPLDREMEIMQWQWDNLDAMAAGKDFSLSEVMVYKLKLQLLIRMHSFSKKQGERILISVVNPRKNKED